MRLSNNMDYFYEQKPEGISKSLLFINAGLVILALIVFILIYGATQRPKPVVIIDDAKVAGTTPFQNLNLDAKAVYVYDMLKKQVLFKKNEFVQLPLASLTKLMMAVTATELLPKNSKITIRPEFLQEEGDSGLLVNESWELSDLLDYSLVVSSNDGARSIASVVGAFDLQNTDYDLGRKDFILQMNKKAQSLGLKQTYFVNESGLDIDEVSGGYGSAIDMATLLQYIVTNDPDLLEATKYPTITISSDDTSHTGRNTNSDVGDIPALLGSKTGFTEMAGGNLVVAFDASIGHPIVIVVLGSTEQGRFKDVDKLVQASLSYATSTPR